MVKVFISINSLNNLETKRRTLVDKIFSGTSMQN